MKKLPTWLDDIQEELSQLEQLKTGWDGYNGIGVKPEVSTETINLLSDICTTETPCPSLVPGSDGSVQVEWASGGIELEIDIYGDGEINASLTSYQDVCDIEIGGDLSIIKDWIKMLH